MKKRICIMLAAAILGCAAMVSCGSNEDKNTSSAQAANVTENIDVVSVADKLKNDITYKDTLTELSSDMIAKLFGLTAGTDYITGKVYVGSGGATAEEIACFEAKDSAGAAKIKETLEKRVESQKKAFENYQPKEMDKLNSPIITVKGNYVMMCISDDNAKAQEIMG